MNPYLEQQILKESLGNNAFAWELRKQKYGKSPTLTVAPLIQGTLEDVKIGKDIVFEEFEDGELKSCRGLENFVQIFSPPENGESEGVTQTGNPQSVIHPNLSLSRKESYIPPVTIFDNHNHALYFWIDAVRKGIIEKGFELIHIDEHSDLWDNPNPLDLERAIESEQYAWEFTNLSCNVGNYIQPALDVGLVGKIIRIENEYQIDTYMDYIPHQNSVLNLDLDIFAPELDHIPEEKKIQCIRNLMKQVKYVTIATSPFFIDQGTALQYLQTIRSLA